MRKSTIILNVGLWSFALLSLWMHLRLQDEVAANAQLRAQLARPQRMTPPGTADRVNGGAPANGAVSASAPPVVTANTTPSTLTTARLFQFSGDDSRKLFADPEYRRAWRIQTRVGLETQYRDIARILHMPREMKDRMIDQLVDDMLADQQEPATADRNARKSAALEKIIGKERVQGLNDYHESLFERQQVDEVRAELGDGADALRADQMERLVAEMYGARVDSERELRDSYVPSSVMDSATRDRQESAQREFRRKFAERARTAAVGVLSREQLAAFDAVMQRRRDMEEASTLTMRKMMDQAKKNQPSQNAPDTFEATIDNAP